MNKQDGLHNLPGYYAVLHRRGDPPGFDSPDLFEKRMDPHHIAMEAGQLNQVYHSRFRGDRILDEDEDCLLLLDGIILNLTELSQRLGTQSLLKIIKRLYRDHGASLVDLLRGEFSGCFYERASDTWLVFTGPTGTKRVFYTMQNGVLLVASRLKLLAQMMSKAGASPNIDLFGAYCLLTCGYMLDEVTLIQNARRLRPGHYLQFKRGQIAVAPYRQFLSHPKLQIGMDDAIEEIDSLFRKAVTLEYAKDRESGYRHLATLSGGLDSRMSVLTACDLGYTDITCFTYAPTGSPDYRIAREIALDYGLAFDFVPLDNGRYLKNIREPVLLNDGLVAYHGSAHLLDSIRSADLEEYGLFHTGMIGDGILGSLLSRPYHVKPMGTEGALSLKLFDVILSDVRRIANRYETEEEFKMYNRGFNSAMNGHWSIDPYLDSSSVFLDPDLISFCMALPPSLKYKQRVYIKWICSRNPRAASFQWERTRTRPSAGWLVGLARKSAKVLSKTIVGDRKITMLLPLDYWFRNDATLPAFMNTYLEQNIGLLNDEPSLRRDVERLYRDGCSSEKLQALSLLEAVALLFH